MFSTVLRRNGESAKRLAPVEELFAHGREAREFYAALVAAGKGKDVLAWGRGLFARSIEERLNLRMAGVETDATRRATHAHAPAGSLFALLDWWIDKGMKADSGEMDEVFHRMAWSR